MSTATESTIAEDAAKAADVIDANGLNKGFLYDEEQADSTKTAPAKCAVDIIGAINIAVCGQPLLGLAGEDGIEANIDRAQAVYTAVARHLDIPVATLTDWSDAEDRTSGDVAKALRDTAASLREAS